MVRGAKVRSGVGKSTQLGRRSGDTSASGGASVLASLYIEQDQGIDIFSRSVVPLPDMRGDKAADIGANEKSTVDCDLNACTKAGNVNFFGVNAFIRHFFRICKLKLSKSICKQVLEERNEVWAMQAASTSDISGRLVVFIDNVCSAILDGKEIDMSFDSFPYYLRHSSILCYIYCNTMYALNLFFLIFECVPCV